MKRIIYWAMALTACTCLWTACNEERESLDLMADATIHGFVINGVQGEIDNKALTVSVLLPPKTDVSALTPEIALAEGAIVEPASGEVQDFTSEVEYTVYNGNLYNTYKVSVEAISARITRFVLNGQYSGIIDQQNRTISVTVPTTVDITNMLPTIEYTEGAVLSPSASLPQDFTNPVLYSLEYMGSTFTYEVTVTQSDHAYAFLGTAATLDALSNADERTAAEWMLQNVPNSRYVSLETLQDGSTTLSSFTAVWFHYEQTNTLPMIATNRTVTETIKSYYEQGGNIFLSGTACLYTGSLGITPSTYVPNNPFGSFGTADQVNAPGENWGIAITGCESHPIYKDLAIDQTTQSWPVVWLIGGGISWRRNIGCPWDLVSPYEQDWADWSSKTGGVPLASFNWDDDCNEKVAISVFEGIPEGKGTAVCVGAPSYDWYYEQEAVSANAYYSNIEKLTLNIFDYLSE